MRIEINNKPFIGFKTASATVRIDAMANSFAFESAIGKGNRIDFGLDDECSIYISNERIITGHIEKITGSGSATTASIFAEGRDKTGDLADSGIANLASINVPITFKAVIELIIAHIGADIDVVDLTSSIFDASRINLAPEPGDNAFEYLEKLARSLSVILSSDADGNVVIQKSVSAHIGAGLINIEDGTNNNVILYNFDFDKTKVFSKYVSTGSGNMGWMSFFNGLAGEKLVDQKGKVIDDSVRPGRQFVIDSETPGDNSVQLERAKWQRNIRRAKSKVYNATVSGFENQASEIWVPNTIVEVVDDHANINDRMLIKSVTYRFDQGSDGRSSAISCMNKDAYNLEISEPVSSNSESPLAKALQGIL